MALTGQNDCKAAAVVVSSLLSLLCVLLTERNLIKMCVEIWMFLLFNFLCCRSFSSCSEPIQRSSAACEGLPGYSNVSLQLPTLRERLHFRRVEVPHLVCPDVFISSTLIQAAAAAALNLSYECKWRWRRFSSGFFSPLCPLDAFHCL